MISITQSVPCPKGHDSAALDYCSECGAKIAGSDGKQDVEKQVSSATTADACPDCGALREHGDITFCEVCGYNFVTGAHGEIGLLPEPARDERTTGVVATQPEAVGSEPPSILLGWKVVILDDPQQRKTQVTGALGDPERSVSLDRPYLLIGRHDEALGIAPEIDLFLDEAVSRRHALVKVGHMQQVSVRDIGAANGTKLNGTELEPMVDYPMQEGDEIALGHWSKLRLVKLG